MGPNDARCNLRNQSNLCSDAGGIGEVGAALGRVPPQARRAGLYSPPAGGSRSPWRVSALRVTIPHAGGAVEATRNCLCSRPLCDCRKADSGAAWSGLGEMAEEDAALVLYVEDEPAVLELGVSALEEGGFRVASASTAAEAIRQLEAPDAAFAALVTDIDLRDNSSGWEVARRARELFPDLPVVYVSGGSAHEWASRGVPGSVMLTKPFALAQLVVAVSNATLERPGPGG